VRRTARKEDQVKKIAVRIAVFVSGAWLIFVGWHKGHAELLNLQNAPVTPTASYAPEILAVAGAFLILAAFAPSPAVLGRWMSRKRRTPVPHAHFRRKRKN
jgi:hypothetical protein